MPLAPLLSAQATSAAAQDKVQGIYGETPLYFMYGLWTGTSAAQGEATMFTLPPGRIALHYDLCRVYAPDEAVATANLSVGHGAYVNQAGTAVVADPNEWIDAADVGGALVDSNFRDGTDAPAANRALLIAEYNSQTGIPVTFTIDTANIDNAATVELIMYFSKG